ncbi:alpha/beta fold hydrolase [Streptosporangium lutulentum]|uniref:Pimeloyl-ACP methyl ester carboxylesterase n=1 Tax=Streptosporangium lutulentum TaxID=1461250 RepID=A0ABT9QL04_9ACTN|nr:alpha/beta hydrolase [Streptosporangium lutulentum]MDP9847436.1 pimeloyl-ACP methyl ester carboxylesterase [Streptosporangium lutulentum]
MTYANIGDHRLFYTDDGAGDQTVLLLHAAICDSHDWSSQIGPFAAGHRVIAPDLRGHGRSSETPGNHTPKDFAEDLALLLDRIGTGPVVVVGHSLGGTVASVLAVEWPDLVRGVVAVDPGYGFDAGFAAESADAFRGPDPIAVATALLSNLESTERSPATDWLPTWHHRRVLGMSPVVVAETFIGLFETSGDVTRRPTSENYLRRRACPVLTVSTRTALTIRGVDVGWDESVASAHPYSLAVAWDTGHWPQQERPEKFNTLVLGWISGLPS